MSRHPAFGLLFVVVPVLLHAGAAFAQDNPYPETVEGLAKLGRHLLDATKADDKDQLTKALKSLVVPAHEAFFKKLFGDDLGGKVAADYSKNNAGGEAELVKLFARLAADGKTNVVVYKVTDNPKSEHGTGLQFKALAAMKEGAKTPLYFVRFAKPGEQLGTSVWSWGFVEGKWRLLGKMRAVSPAADTN